MGRDSLHHGLENNASTDADQISKWWQTFPRAAVGLVMGKNGLIAIDADRHGGPDGVEAFNQLANGSCPAHPIIDTEGNGEHYLFRQPEGVELRNGRNACLPPASMFADAEEVGCSPPAL